MIGFAVIVNTNARFPGIRLQGERPLDFRLQGERPLERRNRQDSSNAYDSQLISKIGRQKTPPPSAGAGSQEELPFSRMSFSRQSTNAAPSENASVSILDSPLRSESSRSWQASPPASISSPGLISFAASATRALAAQRSPPPPDSWPLHRPFGSRNGEAGMGRHSSRRAGSDGSILGGGGYEDASTNPIRRDKRGGSYDQSIFTQDFDSDFSSEETGRMRHLHLDDRSPPTIDVYSPESRLGMKRKASPSLQDTPQHEEKFGSAGPSTSDLFQRRPSAHLPPPLASPKNRYHPTIGSVSSTSSSGLRNGSYASSAALSVAGSSISNISLYEQRLSPGVSPLSEYHEPREQPTLSSLQHGQYPPILRLGLNIATDIASSPEIPRKMSTEGIKAKLHEPPKLQSNLHICVCCPKKPKKFNTQAELRYNIHPRICKRSQLERC